MKMNVTASNTACFRTAPPRQHRRVMTKSSGLTREEKVRRKLETRYHTTFYATGNQRSIQIAGGKHKFDLVSSKPRIVGEVKSTKYPPAEKSLPTKVGDVSRDILLLLGVKRAKERLMVLTNKKFYDFFINTRQARIADSLGVKTILVEA